MDSGHNFSRLGPWVYHVTQKSFPIDETFFKIFFRDFNSIKNSKCESRSMSDLAHVALGALHIMYMPHF